MTARHFALCVLAAGLAGCAAGPQGPAYSSGSTRDPAPQEYRHGMFGDLTWNADGQKSAAPAEAAKAAPAAASVPAGVSAAEQEEFKKWREAAGATERQEFEEWRAWQEWKRKNPK